MDVRTLKIMKNMLVGKLMKARDDEKKGIKKSIELFTEQIEYLEGTPEIDGNIIQTAEELSDVMGL